jgi:hypothetical protein
MSNQIVVEGAMSIPLSIQAPAIVHSVGVEDARGPLRVARVRNDLRDPPSALAIAYRDIVDEVRLRMARRGYVWE